MPNPYFVGANEAKRQIRRRVKKFRAASVKAAASLSERAPKLKRYWKRDLEPRYAK